MIRCKLIPINVCIQRKETSILITSPLRICGNVEHSTSRQTNQDSQLTSIQQIRWSRPARSITYCLHHPMSPLMRTNKCAHYHSSLIRIQGPGVTAHQQEVRWRRMTKWNRSGDQEYKASQSWPSFDLWKQMNIRARSLERRWRIDRLRNCQSGWKHRLDSTGNESYVTTVSRMLLVRTRQKKASKLFVFALFIQVENW